MNGHAAELLGYDLYEMGFRPVPDVDDEGRLVGVRMWRVRTGFLEYVTLHPSGLAMAGRIVAEFDYRHPFEHGPVLETRRGYVLNVLRWLLSDMDIQRKQPWDDPQRLMAGRSGEPDTARHRLLVPDETRCNPAGEKPHD
jgi:hypothetical protein